MTDIDRLLADDAAQKPGHSWKRAFVPTEMPYLPQSRSILLRVNPFMARALTRAAQKQNVSRTTYMRRALMAQLLEDLDDVTVEQLDHPWDKKKRHYGG